MRGVLRVDRCHHQHCAWQMREYGSTLNRYSRVSRFAARCQSTDIAPHTCGTTDGDQGMPCLSVREGLVVPSASGCS
eukprot:2040440-Amphidinium_carterae.1